MARLASNMDKTSRGDYIAYDRDGFAFRCWKLTDGSWYARPSHTTASSDSRSFGAVTLGRLAAKIGYSSRSNERD